MCPATGRFLQGRAECAHRVGCKKTEKQLEGQRAPGGGDMSGEERKVLSEVLRRVDLSNSLSIPLVQMPSAEQTPRLLSHPEQFLPQRPWHPGHELPPLQPELWQRRGVCLLTLPLSSCMTEGLGATPQQRRCQEGCAQQGKVMALQGISLPLCLIQHEGHGISPCFYICPCCWFCYCLQDLCGLELQLQFRH